jgi:ComF family protein
MAARINFKGRSAASMLRTTACGLFSVLFPSNCRFCDAPLMDISRLPVCGDCLDAIQPIAGALCSRCGERLSSRWLLAESEGEAVCGECRRLQPPFLKAAAYAGYSQGMRELIHLLKYEQVRPAAAVLGRMLAQVISGMEAGFASCPPLVVPVPLHSARSRERGFNQAELIARAALGHLPAEWQGALRCGMVVRHRATLSQTGLTQQQRRANLRGAFRVMDRAAVAGGDVLLVDDVYTTGTTVSECARILRAAGAQKIWVATVARVLRPEMSQVELPEEGSLVMAARA